jgi:PAS domain S-box-containing protein
MSRAVGFERRDSLARHHVEPLSYVADEVCDFLERAAIPMHIVASDGTVLWANRAELDLLGYSAEEYVGRNIADCHADRPVIEDILRRLAAGETIKAREVRLRCKDGSIRWGELTSNAHWVDNRFVHSRCFTMDVTARKNAEAQAQKELATQLQELTTLHEVAAQLAAIVESSEDAIVSKSLDGTIRSWNSGASRIFGYTEAEALGRPITMIIPAELHDQEKEIIARISRGERVEHFETVRVAKDGRRVDVSLTVSPVRDGSGKVVGASKVGRDITARKASEAALREANRRKDEFIATLAHELRNPLAPIMNGLQLLDMIGSQGESAVKTRSMIGRQARHLVRLVDDLLDVSRINEGKIDLRNEEIDLRSVVANALETLLPALEAARHTLDLNISPDPIVLRGDSVRLAQVIGNLLNNAIKYTDAGGNITVSASRQGAFAVVSVRDNGIGISADLLPRIFDMFVQGDSLLSRASSGLGIGLTLAQKLVELHGGTIAASSDGVGRGSEFIVRLPARPALERAPAANRAKAALAADRRRILVVDDNVDAAQCLGLMLSQLGHDVRILHDGLEAVEAGRNVSPDLVFLDIAMPGVDGFEVVRRLRKMPELTKTRFVALSGHSQQTFRERARDAGFDEYCVKPIAPESLSELLAAPGQPTQ